MKRVRDESNSGAQFKRPAGSSRGELHGQSQQTAGGGGTGQRLTTDDALQYLKQVKEMFQDQREKYEHFLEVMKDFKSQRVDTQGVIARVKELFKGHNNLIYGFNTFLPKGYEITLDDEGPPPPKKVVEFEEAIDFVNKIKRRFHNDDQVYKSFLEILNMYRKEHKTITEVYDEVSQLFEEHPDLLEEFTRFLPDNSSGSTARHLQRHRRDFPPHDRNPTVLPPRQMHGDKRGHKDRVSSSHEHEPTGDRPGLEDGKATKLHKDSRKRDKDHQDRNGEPEQENKKDVTVQCHSDKRKPVRKVEGFGARPIVATSGDKNSLKGSYSQEFMFCEKVKEKLGSADDYQAFLKCLQMYSTEIITRSELQNLVADLLGKFPDLMEGFREFLERCENIDEFLAGALNKRCLLNESNMPRSVKVDDKDKAPKREIELAKEKPNRDYISKSIQELDLSDCERCTPSYRLLPDDYSIPTVSQRSEEAAQVLNDNWVSVTSGSEDYSFKHMRRNQYEDSLFRCEDDRFELDMLLESVRSTAKRAEDLLDDINNNIVGEDGPIHIEDYFTVLNLRCIERLYGDHGLDVIDTLRKTPSVGLPIILTRIKQKQDEWTKCRVDFNKVWAEVYAKNHYKSLDHRSFYFKQQDSKNLSSKSLIAEIREIKKTLQKEDDILLAVAAGNKRPLVPHLKFQYSDSDIHKDVYKLIKFSCDEVCTTKEQLNQVMKIWTSFMEPLLGVCLQSHGEDFKASNQDAGNSDVGATNRGVSVCDSDATCRESLLTNTKAKNQNEVIASGGVPAQLPSSSSTTHNNVQEPVSDSDAIQPSLGDGANIQNSKSTCCLEESVGQSKVEKEEGELSPNGEVEEDSPTTYESKEKVGMENHKCQGANVEAKGVKGDGDGDDGDDDDSENAYEGADRVSRSESAGDECSQEEHEEEDGGDLEGKVESEGGGELHHMGDGTTSPLSDRSLSSVKPLAKYLSLDSQDAQKNDSSVFYGHDSFYVLFRLHQILYERMLSAKMSSMSSETRLRNSKDVSPSDPYSSFMDSLFHLLDGTYDNAKFEDDCRETLGNQSYVLFTLDKLIYKLVKQLQAVADDEMDNKVLQLHEYEQSRTPGKFIDSVYHDNTRVILPEENIYRFEFSSSPSCLSIQLMDHGKEKADMVAVSIEPSFATYLFNDFLSTVSGKNKPQGIMLQRSKREYAALDEHSATIKAMEDVELFNGLECKIACNSSKISYVLDTEDFLFRPKKKRKSLSSDQSARLNEARMHRFHKFLSG